MKRKNCVTDSRRKMKIGILTSFAILLCIALSLGYVRFAQGYRVFRAPTHEAAAAGGLPAAGEGWQELPVKEGYTIGLETMPMALSGALQVNLANYAENAVWILARVYQGEELIGQTGILYQGEYVAHVPCEKTVSAGDTVLLQIIAYEPETYHSEGVARISCQVQ